MRTRGYFQNIANTNPKYDMVIDDFSGGLNNRTDVIEDNQTPYLINMRYDETRGFVKRQGTTLFDELELPDPIEYMDEYKPYSAPDVLIRATRYAIYSGSTLIKQINGVIDGTNYTGYYMLADGNSMMAYGKFPQEENIYTKIIGTPNPGNVILTVKSPPDDYIPLGQAHVQGVTVFDYGSGFVHYEPCELEVADTYKGANVVPTSIQYLTQNNGRLYASGAKDDDDNVFITDIQNPFYFPVFLPIQLPPNSDKVRGLAVYDNAVIVSREFDMHAIRGNTTRNDIDTQMFGLYRLNVHSGFANNSAHNVSHNYLFYIGADGQCYALMNASSGVNLTTTILNKQVDFLKAPFGKAPGNIRLDKEDVVNSKTYFFDNDWHIAIGNYVALYNYETRSWSLYSGLNANCFYHKDYKLMIGRKDGFTTIFTPDSYLDLGEPFLATWHSKRYDLGDPLMFKHFRDFFISLFPHPDFLSDVRITVMIDGKEVNIIDVARSMVSRYGKSVWGDLYITADMAVQVPFYVNMRGRTIQFKISNSWDVSAEVFEFGDLTTVNYRRFNETLAKTTSDNKYWLFTADGWIEKLEEDINQPLKFIQIAGEYELRRRRW